MEKLINVMNKYNKQETPKRLTRSASKDSLKLEGGIAKDHLDLVIKERKNKFTATDIKTKSKTVSTTAVKKSTSLTQSKIKTPFPANKGPFLNKTQFKLKNALSFKKDNINIKKPESSTRVAKSPQKNIEKVRKSPQKNCDKVEQSSEKILGYIYI
jgi:hypothetical protein